MWLEVQLYDIPNNGIYCALEQSHFLGEGGRKGEGESIDGKGTDAGKRGGKKGKRKEKKKREEKGGKGKRRKGKEGGTPGAQGREQRSSF